MRRWGDKEARHALTAEHKRETRQRIVSAARHLFKRRGFADVSIDEIMAEAGLTRGGFYKHFRAKDDLYAEAVVEFICAPRPEAWQHAHIAPGAEGERLARMILEAHLSEEHFGDRPASCPMIALPSDVARGRSKVRGAFRKVFDIMAGAFEAGLKPGRREARERALAMVSLAVGAMVLGRAIGEPALAAELRASAINAAGEIAGWRARAEAAE